MKALSLLRRLIVLPLMLAAALAAPASHAASMSDYLENKTIDYLFRGESFTPAATLYIGLTTTACSDAATGTEVTGGSYARVAITSNLTNWSGTQSAGSTLASSGTAGRISNNAAVTFTTPTAGWGTVGWVIIMDAATSGNMYVCQALTSSKTINSGDPVSFGINALGITIN